MIKFISLALYLMMTTPAYIADYDHDEVEQYVDDEDVDRDIEVIDIVYKSPDNSFSNIACN